MQIKYAGAVLTLVMVVMGLGSENASAAVQSMISQSNPKLWTYTGRDVVFTVDDQLAPCNGDPIFGDPISGDPPYIKIDFGDGAGAHLYPLNDTVHVHYTGVGRKVILRSALCGTPHVSDDSNSQYLVYDLPINFEVRDLDSTKQPDNVWTDFYGPSYTDASGANYPGYGNVYIYNSKRTPGAPLVNPVIVIDGFDPDNTRNEDEIYEIMNKNRLLETGRDRGLDFVVLDPGGWDWGMSKGFGGAEYIQRNALLLEALIQKVNQVKVGSSPLVVIGPSMGGLIARYALADMERRNIPHNTRLFVSFDSPQRGANIPLGDQYFLEYFADYSAEALANLNKLKTPAARQMLVYSVSHFSDGGSRSVDSKIARADDLFTPFYNELASLGYPKKLRKIALANGRGDGVGQGFNPGDPLVQYTYGAKEIVNCNLLIPGRTDPYIVGDTWAVGSYATIFHGNATCGGVYAEKDPEWITLKVAVLPYDTAPGGSHDATQQIADSSVEYGDVTTTRPYAAFVPTVSALDINTTDLFYNVAGDANIYAKTPFDKIYFATAPQSYKLDRFATTTVMFNNEQHIDITAEKAQIFLNEITMPWLTPVINFILQ